MELLTAQEASPKTIENFLLKELKLRPSDPSLRIQYVNFLKVGFNLAQICIFTTNCLYLKLAHFWPKRMLIIYINYLQ